MDSSPPLRPQKGDTLPHSPAHSDYSIDLNAMTQDTHEEPLSPLPTRRIDEVRSDDIDGPSDFTENMEDWMRGTHKGKSTVNKGTHSRAGTLARGSVRQMFSQAPADPIDEEEEEADQLPTAADDADPSPSKPANAANGDMNPTPRVARDSSVWDAYGNPSPSSSPHPALDKRLLQPTVEDYNSELSLASPARPLSAPPTHTHDASRLSNVLFAAPEPTDDLSAVQQQLAELRALHEKTELKAQHFEEQLRSVEEARVQLRAQLETSTAALAAANEANAGLKRLAEVEGQLVQVTAEAQDAQRALKRSRAEAEEVKTQLEEMRESEDAELQDLRGQIERKAEVERGLRLEVEELRGEMAKAAGNAEKSSEDVKRLKKELEESRVSRMDADQTPAEVERLREDPGTAHKKLADTKAELALVQSQQPQQRKDAAELDAAKLQIVHLREELDLLQDLSRLDDGDHSEETPKHSPTHDDHAKDMAAIRSRMEAAEVSLKDAQTLAEERRIIIDSLRRELVVLHEQAASNQAQKQELQVVQELAAARQNYVDDLRRELDALQSRDTGAEQTSRELHLLELRDAKELTTKQGKEIDRLKREIAVLAAGNAGDEEFRLSERKRLDLHARMEGLRAELDGLRTANAEMDARVAAALGKREERWLEKEREWERERKVMVKALLRQWGREECGIDSEEQRFRYRYGKGLKASS